MPVTQVASAAGPAGGGIDPVSPIVIVSAPVDVDHAAAVGLLRWCEAWLHRFDIGEALPAHVLVDVGHTRRVAPSGWTILEQARAESGRRQVGIHLVGVGSLLAASSLQARRCLGRWSSFPSLDAARAALAEPRGREAERCAPVDPDAIVFTSPAIPDRLR
jgi:hypothetical protein